MRDGHRGARSRPVLLYTKGGESKGSDEVLCGERDHVGAIAIIRRVDNEGDVIRQHFVDIKDNTSTSVSTERVPSNDRTLLFFLNKKTLSWTMLDRPRRQFFFWLHAAKVRSSCEEGPGQSALQSAYHNPKLDVSE